MRHKHGLTTLQAFFFFENAKNLGRSDDAKQTKKRGCPFDEKVWKMQTCNFERRFR